MQLDVLERLVLLNILPSQGTVTTVRIVNDLREALSFSEEEHTALNFISEEGNTRWDVDAVPNTEISIGPRAHRLIAETLEKLSEAENMTPEYLSVWEKFVGEKDD